MPRSINKAKAGEALVGLWAVALTAFIACALYIAREVLIPLSLAALLTFLFAPLVTRLERWIGRVVAVLLVVTLICIATAATAWVLTGQLVDLAIKLPDYKQNIQAKLRAFKVPTSGAIDKVSKTIEELKKELPGAETTNATRDVEHPEIPTTSSSVRTEEPVRVIQTSQPTTLELMQRLLAPLLGPIGTAGLVLLLLTFMLLEREDLRNRVIRLIGHGRISMTTRAMDEAGQRVSRYLFMQLVVNVTYGVPVAIGLYFIGVPNAVLWGAFAIILRFIPYIGPWIAAGFPILLSLAVSPGWTMPVLTIGLFIVLELISNNVVEPWLYGANTGVSSMALIVAAVFWTWLWGPVGLILATPLTVCLVVMGRHVPRLSFLSVLLSDEQPLTPAEDCYHRLLTVGEQDEMELVESYLKSNPLSSLYDSVLVPVITAVETDYRQQLLDNEQRAIVLQSLTDVLDDLATRPLVSPPADSDASASPPDASLLIAPPKVCRVYCLPARAERDEMAGAMLVHLLGQQGFQTQNGSAKLVVGEIISQIEKIELDALCVSVVVPSTVIHARYLCLKLRSAFPKQNIVVGLWGASENVPEATRRLKDSGATEVVTTLAEAVVQMAKFAH